MFLPSDQLHDQVISLVLYLLMFLLYSPLHNHHYIQQNILLNNLRRTLQKSPQIILLSAHLLDPDASLALYIILSLLYSLLHNHPYLQQFIFPYNQRISLVEYLLISLQYIFLNNHRYLQQYILLNNQRRIHQYSPQVSLPSDEPHDQGVNLVLYLLMLPRYTLLHNHRYLQ